MLILSESSLRPSRQTYALFAPLTRGLRTLTVSLGRVITICNNQILWSVVVLAAQVTFQDSLGAICVSLLSIERGTGHVRNHGVSAAEWVLCVSEGMILWCWLREPNITTVSAEVTRLESLSNIFLDDNSSASGVDEP